MKTRKRKKSYPAWAKYKARDLNGQVWVYEHEPRVAFGVFIPSAGESQLVKSPRDKEYKSHWTESKKKIDDFKSHSRICADELAEHRREEYETGNL